MSFGENEVLQRAVDALEWSIAARLRGLEQERGARDNQQLQRTATVGSTWLLARCELLPASARLDLLTRPTLARCSTAGRADDVRQRVHSTLRDADDDHFEWLHANQLCMMVVDALLDERRVDVLRRRVSSVFVTCDAAPAVNLLVCDFERGYNRHALLLHFALHTGGRRWLHALLQEHCGASGAAPRQSAESHTALQRVLQKAQASMLRRGRANSDEPCNSEHDDDQVRSQVLSCFEETQSAVETEPAAGAPDDAADESGRRRWCLLM